MTLDEMTDAINVLWARQEKSPPPDKYRFSGLYLCLWPDGSGKIIFQWAYNGFADPYENMIETAMKLQGDVHTELNFDDKKSLVEYLQELLNKGPNMIVEELRARQRAARKSGNRVELSIVTVALGEVQLVKSREGKIDEDRAVGIVRKLVASNLETIGHLCTEETMTKDVLEQEIAILKKMLPQQWDEAQAREFVYSDTDLVTRICGAANDGAAIGVAMKAIKDMKLPVDGKIVASLVRHMRV